MFRPLVVLLLGSCGLARADSNDSLCYWIDEANSWASGEKATINIRLDQDYDDWKVTFVYDVDVVNVEAWKGDVEAVNQTTFDVKSRCYNSKLYACQVLSFGFVLRHFPGTDPSEVIYLNDVPVPPCQPECPYLADPGSELLCQLWSELQELSNQAISTAVTANPSTSYSVGPTPAPTYTIECEYADHLTNATALCDLWCSIIAYDGGLCLSQDQCPYTLQVSETLLCDLWDEIQLANTSSLGSTPSADLSSLLGNATAVNGELSYNDCPYLSDDNSFTACYLWCELRELSSSESCSDAPVCPYENFPEPYNQLLCNLWMELQSLEAASQTTQASPSPPSSSPPSSPPSSPTSSPSSSPTSVSSAPSLSSPSTTGEL